jgi:hypothetical protein
MDARAAGPDVARRMCRLRGAEHSLVPQLRGAAGLTGAGTSAALVGRSRSFCNTGVCPTGLCTRRVPRSATHRTAGLQGARSPRSRGFAGWRARCRAVTAGLRNRHWNRTRIRRGMPGAGAVAPIGRGSPRRAARDAAGAASGCCAGQRRDGGLGRSSVAVGGRSTRLRRSACHGSAGQPGRTGAVATERAAAHRYARRARRRRGDHRHNRCCLRRSVGASGYRHARDRGARCGGLSLTVVSQALEHHSQC